LLALNAAIWFDWQIDAPVTVIDRLRPRVTCPHFPVNDF
jgi:hypothetical protein